jgi:hypothetical protein
VQRNIALSVYDMRLTLQAHAKCNMPQFFRSLARVRSRRSGGRYCKPLIMQILRYKVWNYATSCGVLLSKQNHYYCPSTIKFCVIVIVVYGMANWAIRISQSLWKNWNDKRLKNKTDSLDFPFRALPY